MLDISNPEELLAVIPHRPPFRFIDQILEATEKKSIGTYHFKKDEFFYQGHFPGIPVTPSVILIECMAQIGLIPIGLVNYAKDHPDQDFDLLKPIFTNSDSKFVKPVYPETTVTVEAENIYFRMNRLKAKVKLRDEEGDLCCSGILSGVFVSNENITF